MTHLQQIENLFDRAIGFEGMWNRLNQLHETNPQGGYPPYNIVKDGEKYTVELAVAGFKKDEISIELKDNQLVVTGEKSKEKVETTYIHKGIGARAFTRTFTLSDDVVVRGADMFDGILFIELERVIPEEKKPRKIVIGSLDVADKQFLSERSEV